MKTMKCVYCGNEKKSTREHIIPDSFIKGMNKDEQIRWTQAAPCRVVKSDFVVKDVCADCNNGVLSQLDTYAVNLITKYNGKIDKNTKKIFFKYDYNKLSRWLLKICYNSARANKLEYDTSSYRKCIPYILEDKEINNKISIYGLLMDLSINGKIHDYYHFDSNSKYTIDFFRIAPFKLKEMYTHRCSMRGILINSFAFLVIVYDEDINEVEVNKIEESIMKTNFNFEKLEGSKKIKLNKDKMFWKNSLYTNVIRNDGFLLKSEPVNDTNLYIIEISKEEILEKNYSQIQEFIVSKRDNKQNVKDNYQKFIISVAGYDDDKRALYCINEFQEYTKEIIDNFPEIIWYIYLEMGFFEAMLLAYINNNDTPDMENNISVNQEKVFEFINKCYFGINKLINDFALDNSYNDKITNLFNTTTFRILGIPQDVNL